MNEHNCERRQHAVVTGAGSGIGKAVTLALAERGWRVLALDIEAAGLDQFELIRNIKGIVCDVGDESAVAAVFECLAWEKLDLLINNGGPADPVSGPLDELSLADWHHWLRPHLDGAFLMGRACLPLLRRAHGSIINIASTRAFMSEPHTYGYAAAKGGLVALTHALAIGEGPTVRANAIAPGWIAADGAELSANHHEMHPVGRVGRARDIVQAVFYLTEAEFVTGQCLVVDGGMVRKMNYE